MALGVQPDLGSGLRREVISPRVNVSSVSRLHEAASEREGLLCLDRNERVTPLPDSVSKVIGAKLAELDPTRYPNPDHAYEALQRSFGRGRNQALLTPGSDGALRSLFQAYVNQGDVVVTVRPSYAMYEVYAQLAGAEVRAVDCGADRRFSVPELCSLIDNRVRLVLLANPNQPTGTMLSDAELAQTVDAVASAGALLAIDEAYAPFARASALERFGDHPNVLILQSFSKAWGLAGLRVAAAFAQPPVITALATVRSVYDINAAALIALGVLLDHLDFFVV